MNELAKLNNDRKVNTAKCHRLDLIRSHSALIAVANSDTAVAQNLFDCRATVNARDYRSPIPLHLLTKNGQVNRAQKLLLVDTAALLEFPGLPQRWSAQRIVLHGLGGTGKTQFAVEITKNGKATFDALYRIQRDVASETLPNLEGVRNLRLCYGDLCPANILFFPEGTPGSLFKISNLADSLCWIVRTHGKTSIRWYNCHQTNSN
jgi:hypothetical protein